MATPQGTFSFRGIKYPISASYTMTPGVSPGVINIAMAPQLTGMRGTGDVVIAYGSTRIRLRDCIVDSVTASRDASGFETWRASLLDRRWKWRGFGQISGRYNMRRWSGSIVSNPATPKELLAKCLEALGEKRYNLSRVPNKQIVEVEWDYEKPSLALASLADTLGCVVVLGVDGFVSIVPKNYGTRLPSARNAIEASYTYDPPETPDSLVAVGDITRYQADWNMEPVGLEANGSVVNIENLSYAPEKGNWSKRGESRWATADPLAFNCVDDINDRELAIKSVFRWYRITHVTIPTVGGRAIEVAKGKDKGKRKRNRVITSNMALPIEDKQVEWHYVQISEDESEYRPRPPWIYGQWSNLAEGGQANADALRPSVSNSPEGYYPNPFTLDTDTGIVQFEEPLILTTQAADVEGRIIYPANLRLRVAFSVRDPQTQAWERYEYGERMPGARTDTNPRYQVFDDMGVTWYYDHDRGVARVNVNETRKRAAEHVRAMRREYEKKEPALVTYPGFVPVSPTGAIKQVTWQIDGQGFCTTRVARQVEELTVAISETERRWYEEQNRRRAETARHMRHKVEKDV